jgi:hypothetical protein
MSKFVVPKCPDCGAEPYDLRASPGWRVMWKCESRGEVGEDGKWFDRYSGRPCLLSQLAASAERERKLVEERDRLLSAIDEFLEPKAWQREQWTTGEPSFQGRLHDLHAALEQGRANAEAHQA